MPVGVLENCMFASRSSSLFTIEDHPTLLYYMGEEGREGKQAVLEK